MLIVACVSVDSLDGEVTMALSGSPGSLDLMAVPPDVR